MKTTILSLAAILLFIFTACGQSDKNVPASVKSAFSQKFSGATNVKWGKESDKEWEAEFKLGGENYSANFDNAGIWIETEYRISVKEIPAAVKTALNKESAGAIIKVSELTETKDGKFYEFVAGRGENETELVIDKAGNVISKEKVKKENEND
ncbi:MAG: PepSY-like domain-containing protein [Bacteroidales bacterium]